MQYIYAIDYESNYSNTLTIQKMGARQYAQAQDIDGIYMLTVYGILPNGKELWWGGLPKDFDWDIIKPSNDFASGLVAHNMSFDWSMLHRSVELGTAPDWVLDMPTYCSADMAVYNGFSRALANSLKAIFNHEMDKGMRDWMKNRTWDDAIREGKAGELLAYGKDDAKWCWKLFQRLKEYFPEHEAKLSLLTREMAWKGVPASLELMEESHNELDKKRWEILQKLEWTKRFDSKYRQNFKPTSRRGLAEQCKMAGVPMPTSLAEGSEPFTKWVEKYGKEHKFVQACADYTKINVTMTRLEAMMARCYEDKDGVTRLSYGMKYCGADSTLRFSGDTGCNVQNLPRGERFGVYLRHMLKAPEGKVFVICDLSAIEPRLLLLVIGDFETIELLKKGYNPYEAHAIATMGWEDKGKALKDEDPNMYLLAKVRVLALGYGAGWFRFYETVRDFGRLDILDKEPTKKQEYSFGTFISNYAKDKLKLWSGLDRATQRHWVNAYTQVSNFRSSNGKLCKLWKEYEREYKNAEDMLELPLLNGEKLKYFNIRPELNGRSCKTRRGDQKRSWYYGPKIVENQIQREARSVFGNCLLKLDEAGYDVVMHVHDEAIVLVDEENAKDSAEEIKKIMSTPPDWIGDKLPLGAEYQISKMYTK
jgi:hypothetical protein